MARLNAYHHNSAALLEREKVSRVGDFESAGGRSLARVTVKQSTPAEMPATIGSWQTQPGSASALARTASKRPKKLKLTGP